MPGLDELYADVKKRRARRNKKFGGYELLASLLLLGGLLLGAAVAGGEPFADLTLEQSVRAFGITAGVLAFAGAMCRWIAHSTGNRNLDGFGKLLAVMASGFTLFFAVSLA